MLVYALTYIRIYLINPPKDSYAVALVLIILTAKSINF